MNQNLRNKLAVSMVSALALATVMIQNFEGVRYTPYYDVGGVLTVCYGHTGTDIILSKTYTHSECELMLENDLKPFANSVRNTVNVPMNKYQEAALISFSYNVGINAFEKSSVLRLLNAGDYKAACDGLKKWVYVKGKVWKGLINRRQLEREVCLWG
jgi:lysozyme